MIERNGKPVGSLQLWTVVPSCLAKERAIRHGKSRTLCRDIHRFHGLTSAIASMKRQVSGFPVNLDPSARALTAAL